MPLVSVDAYFRCAFRMSTSTDRASGKYIRAQRGLSLRHREYCPSTAPYQAEQKWAAWVEPGERFHCQWAVGRLGILRFLAMKNLILARIGSTTAATFYIIANRTVVADSG